jgi:polyphenol oxidase
MLILTKKTLDLPGIGHGFFGRSGGVSKGLYASLNCAPASKDAADAVRENRRRVAASFGEGFALVTLQQYHSTDVITVTQPWTVDLSPKGDALVTNKPGIILGLVTADCAPVLFADGEAGVIGAAHAGWKGAAAGVCEAAIAAMEKLGAARARIHAAIGPCIGQANYEVGPEFRAEFPDSAASFFVPSQRAGHFRFDLESYVEARLKAAGIGEIGSIGLCTFANHRQFYSYRRATLAGEADYGREISAIVLAP